MRLLLLAIGAFFFPDAAAAAAPPPITLPGGVKLTCSDSGPSTVSCLGIQFGTAERWKRPVMAKLTGSYNATAFGPDCQTSPESCLYLNVYLPKDTHRQADLPVMVWIRAYATSCRRCCSCRNLPCLPSTGPAPRQI